MEDNITLEKFDQYHALNDKYSYRVYELFYEITEQMNDCQKEQIQQLVELAHKEGFLDGIDFVRWITDKLY